MGARERGRAAEFPSTGHQPSGSVRIGIRFGVGSELNRALWTIHRMRPWVPHHFILHTFCAFWQANVAAT